jgi:quercetin 2,3-dioxygenase
MITIRRSQDRGHANHGWLDTYHTFSFSSYQDPAHMGFRKLRVINEDRVAPGAGFPTHPHRDMEIITVVLDGAIEHRDSMGNGSIIRPGDVQRMTAGTGVTHSEFNPLQDKGLHFLQIWILPDQTRLKPSYEQKQFPESERSGKLRLIASRDGSDASITVHQDVKLYASLLSPGQAVDHSLASGRHAWLQVTRGEVVLNGEPLRAGDGASVSDVSALHIEAKSAAEFILFDLA